MSEPTPEIEALILAIAPEKGIYPALAFAVVEAESKFDPNAVGDAGMSYGLMQLHLEGAGAGQTPVELLDPSNNLRIGCAYLRECLDKVREAGIPQGEREVNALSAYNQGIPGWRDRGIINWLQLGHYLAALRKWERRFGLPHLDACYGHLNVRPRSWGKATGELLALKKEIGWEV